MPTSHNVSFKPAGNAAPVDFVLGRDRFAQISAVEGIALTADMHETLDRFDRQDLSAAERRRDIIRRFTPAR